MHNLHPDMFLWLHEQDRQRETAQRALERAARAGGEQRPGLVRGGISSFTRVLRQVASGTGDFHLAGSRRSTDPTGTSGA